MAIIQEEEDFYADAYDDDEMVEPAQDGEDRSQKGGHTALLPKSILMGKSIEVGDTVMLKVAAIHEDEVEVEYANNSKKERRRPPMPEMDEMME